MRHIKSERLKKLEKDLEDLEQWLKLGLVPKKDIEKHKEEIRTAQSKIQDEKDRIQFLKESGDIEEYVAPKRGQQRTTYTEMPTIPDIDMAETAPGMTESNYGDNESTESDNSVIEEADDTEERTTTEETQYDDSYFGEKNRWKRIVDPDADEW